MKKLFAPLVFLCASLAMPGQSHLLQVSMDGETEGWIYLAAYEKDRFMMVDSVMSTGAPLVFVLPLDAPAGIYRLIYNELQEGVMISGRFVEIIYNGIDLNLMVEFGESGPLPYFEQSLENDVYQDFVEFQLAYEQALSACYAALFPQLPGNATYDEALRDYEELQGGRIRYMDSISENYPGLYATRMISAFRVPVVPGSLTHRERMDTLKLLFFEDAPIDDPGLMYAPVYTYRIVDYLSIYQDASLDAEEQQEAFVEAVDQIMVNVGRDPELRSFVVEFLLEGFEILGMGEVQAHLAVNYLDERCNSDLGQLVQERMEADRAMAIGTQVPDFVMRDRDGRNYRLSTLPEEEVLLIFWSTNCGHCRHMMPDLYAWYLEELENPSRDLEVLSFSMDTSWVEYEQYMDLHPMKWINVHDPLGWNGKVPGEYHIYATPTMFLLDRERRIVARPVSMKQLRRALRKR